MTNFKERGVEDPLPMPTALKQPEFTTADIERFRFYRKMSKNRYAGEGIMPSVADCFVLATTIQEVDEMLMEAVVELTPSPSTRRKWEVTADRRKLQLWDWAYAEAERQRIIKIIERRKQNEKGEVQK